MADHNPESSLALLDGTFKEFRDPREIQFLTDSDSESQRDQRPTRSKLPPVVRPKEIYQHKSQKSQEDQGKGNPKTRHLTDDEWTQNQRRKEEKKKNQHRRVNNSPTRDSKPDRSYNQKTKGVPKPDEPLPNLIEWMVDDTEKIEASLKLLQDREIIKAKDVTKELGAMNTKTYNHVTTSLNSITASCDKTQTDLSSLLAVVYGWRDDQAKRAAEESTHTANAQLDVDPAGAELALMVGFMMGLEPQKYAIKKPTQRAKVLDRLFDLLDEDDGKSKLSELATIAMSGLDANK